MNISDIKRRQEELLKEIEGLEKSKNDVKKTEFISNSTSILKHK